MLAAFAKQFIPATARRASAKGNMASGTFAYRMSRHLF